MSKRHWLTGIAVGLGALGLILWPSLNAMVPRLESIPAGTLAAPECRYDEAVRAEADAARNAQAAEKLPQRRLGATERGSASEAAQSRTEEAKECEDRARAWSDLKAQWQSARATSVTADLTRIQVLGTGLEILVLIAALGAASWAAWETRSGTKTTLLIGQNQTRAYLSIRRLQAPEKGTAAFEFKLMNSGQTPARGIVLEYIVFFFRQADRKRADYFRSRDSDARTQADLPGLGADQGVALSNTEQPGVRPLFDRIDENNPASFLCVLRYQDVFQRYFELVQRVDFRVDREENGARAELLSVTHMETTEREIEKAEYDKPIDLEKHIRLPKGAALKEDKPKLQRPPNHGPAPSQEADQQPANPRGETQGQ